MMNQNMRIFYVKCALAVLVVVTFVTQVAFASRGEGYSMQPTLSNDSMVFGIRIIAEYKVGDIVATSPLENWDSEVGVIKRVVAGPGDVVVVDGINLFVNGELIDASVMRPGYPYKEYNLAEDEYFLVGDNRAHSLDSRSRGTVRRSDIDAKILYWLNF